MTGADGPLATTEADEFGLLMKPPRRLLLPEIYNLRADPKELHNIVGGNEGIAWGLLDKDAQIRGS